MPQDRAPIVVQARAIGPWQVLAYSVAPLAVSLLAGRICARWTGGCRRFRC